MVRVKRKVLVYHFGDSFDDLVLVYQDEDLAAIDLSGLTASMQVKDAPGGTLFLSLSSPTTGITIPTPTDGRIVFNVAPSVMTAALIAGTEYVYDIQIKDAGGALVKTLLKGPFIVDQEITVV